MAQDVMAEPYNYLSTLWRRRILLVVVTLVIAATALLRALVETPVYESTTDVLIERQGGLSLSQSLNDALFGQQELATQLEILTSLPVASLAAAEIALGLTDEQVRNRTSARLVGATRVVRISARDDDPLRAQELAAAVAKSYLEFRRSSALELVLGATGDLAARTRSINDRLAVLDDILAEDPEDPVASQERAILLEQLGQISAQRTTLEATDAFARGGGQVLRPATLPRRPVEPNPAREAIIGLLAGLSVGALLALMVDRLDDRARSMNDVTRVTNLPVLAELPRLSVPAGIEIVRNSHSRYAEAIRGLLANVRLLRPPGALKVLLVTSAGTGDGKSSTALNLAVASALSGVRTLLIDADLRRPVIASLTGLAPGPGLAELLRGSVQLTDVARDPDIPNLRVVTSGRSIDGPVELLTGSGLRDVIAVCSSEAEFVIIDAPPALGLADALPLSVQADATLLVVDARTASRRDLVETVARLQRVGASLVGVAGNRVTGRTDPYYGYDYESPAPD